MTFCTAEDGTTVTETVLVRDDVDAASEAGDILVTSLRMAVMSSFVVVRADFLSCWLALFEVDLVRFVTLVEGAGGGVGMGEGVIDVVGGGRGVVVVLVDSETEGDEVVLIPVTANKFTLDKETAELCPAACTAVGQLCLLTVDVPTDSESRLPKLPAMSSNEDRSSLSDAVFALLVRSLKLVGGGIGTLESVCIDEVISTAECKNDISLMSVFVVSPPDSNSSRSISSSMHEFFNSALSS